MEVDFDVHGRSEVATFSPGPPRCAVASTLTSGNAGDSIVQVSLTVLVPAAANDAGAAGGAATLTALSFSCLSISSRRAKGITLNASSRTWSGPRRRSIARSARSATSATRTSGQPRARLSRLPRSTRRRCRPFARGERHARGERRPSADARAVRRIAVRGRDDSRPDLDTATARVLIVGAMRTIRTSLVAFVIGTLAVTSLSLSIERSAWADEQEGLCEEGGRSERTRLRDGPGGALAAAVRGPTRAAGRGDAAAAPRRSLRPRRSARPRLRRRRVIVTSRIAPRQTLSSGPGMSMRVRRCTPRPSSSTAASARARTPACASSGPARSRWAGGWTTSVRYNVRGDASGVHAATALVRGPRVLSHGPDEERPRRLLSTRDRRLHRLGPR